MGFAEPRYGVTSLADLGARTAMAEIDEVLAQEFGPLFGPIAPTYAAAGKLAPSLPAT